MVASKGIILLSAGGTGGHLFPAQALAHELSARGWSIHLATDDRAQKYAGQFPAVKIHVIASGTPSGSGIIGKIRAALALARGMRESRQLLKSIQPKAVVGFGGYPTVPPLVAASGAFPTMIHEQNAVAGRANKMLAGRVTAIAGGFLKAQGPYADKTVETGNPVRPQVLEAAKTPYAKIGKSDPIHLVVFGGSQGAQYFSTALPEALALLPDAMRARIRLTQQARPEDEEEAKIQYDEIGIEADVSPFFSDLPARIGAAHLVIARSGASTVSEVAAIGRPAIFVPYPHALDHDQAANAKALEEAGGAIVRRQADLPPEVLANEIMALLEAPDMLAEMAAASKAAGKPQAATLLADLTEAIASGKSVAEFRATQ